MKDERKTKKQLVNELKELRQRIAELEGAGTERKQVEGAVRRRTAQLESLRRVGLEITADLDLDSLLHSIVSQAVELVQGTAGGLYLYQPDLDELKWAVAVGPDLGPVGTLLRRGEGLSGKVWETGKPLIVDDYQQWDGRLPGYEEHTFRAIMGVPIYWGEELLGVLDVLAESPGTFSAADAELLDLFATQAAIAIRNARLYEQAQTEIAERKQVEGKLRQSEDRYLDLYDNAPDMYFTVRRDGTIISVNRLGAEMLGYEKEELIGRPVDTVFHPEDAALVQGQLDEILKSGEDISKLEFRKVRKDGSVMHVSERVSLQSDPRGEPILRIICRDITERKRAEQGLRQHAAQLEALREVGLKLTAELDLDSLLHAIASQAIELLGGAAASLHLHWPGREVLDRVVSIELDPPPGEAAFRRGEGLSGRVWETGKPLIVDDYRHWEGRAAFWESYPFAAIVGVPIRWGEEFLGVLNVAADTPRAFSPADSELLTLFATQAAIAIQNARLYEEIHRRAERLAAVNRIASAVGAILDLDDLMETVYQEIDSIFQADAFFIALYDEEANELDFRVQVDEGVREPPERQPLEAGLTSLVIDEKEPLCIRNVEQERDRLPPLDLWGTMKLPASWLGVPMLIGERLIGVICVQDYRPYAYGEEEELLLTTIADQVAVAIEQARLHEAERRRASQFESLRQASLRLTSTLELQPILEAILDHALNLAAAGDAHVFLYDGERLTFGAALWEDGYHQKPYSEPRPHGLTSTVAHSGERIVIPDVDSHPMFQDYQWGGAIVGLPLRIGERVVGVMTVAFQKPHTFDESELRVLELLADQAAIAIENARLYEAAQREIAERKRTGEALREAEQRFRSIFENTVIGLYRTSPDGRILMANPALVEMLGYASFEELAQRNLEKEGFESQYPRSLFRQRIEQDGQVSGLESTWVRRDGTPLFVRESAKAVRDEAGNLLHYEGTVEDITERKRAEEALGRRAVQMATLNRIGHDVASILDQEELLQHTVDAVRDDLGYSQAAILLVENESSQLRIAVATDEFWEVIPDDYRQPVGKGAIGVAAETGETVLVGDASSDPRVYRVGDWFSASALATPIKIGGQVIGVLEVEADVPNAFDEDDAMVMATLSDQVAVAIEHARLYAAAQQEIAERKRAEEELQQRQLQLSVLNRMGRALAETFELPRIYRIAYEHVSELVDCSNFGISLYDAPTLTLQAEFMLDKGELIDVARFPPLVMDMEPTQGRVRAIATRQPEIITNYPAVLEKATDTGVRIGVSSSEHVTGAAMYVPMVARGQVIGLLEVQSPRLSAYGLEHASLLGPVANQIGLSIQNAQLYEEVEQELSERKRTEEELRQSFERLQRALEGTVDVLVSAVEMKDPYTAGHQRRVANLACAIARELGLAQEQIEGLRLASLIHDLGKISIPAEILSKPTPLIELEWGIIRTHAQVGHDILKTIDFPWPVAQTVLQHHERLDGSGYPQGLAGKDILMKARILAVADVVEAMASHRPYRPICGLDAALEEISQNRGVLYDPEAVDACVKLITEEGFELR